MQTDIKSSRLHLSPDTEPKRAEAKTTVSTSCVAGPRCSRSERDRAAQTAQETRPRDEHRQSEDCQQKGGSRSGLPDKSCLNWIFLCVGAVQFGFPGRKISNLRRVMGKLNFCQSTSHLQNPEPNSHNVRPVQIVGCAERTV